jgi:uncharacterized protein (DUF1330 family)
MTPILKNVAIAAFAFAATITTATAEPVYMIAQIQIEDQEKYFNEYGAAVFPIVMGTGAKVLVASPLVNTLEGEWAGNWTVVIEFPSEEAAMGDWYNSDAYEAVRELRFATTSVNNLVIAPGFVPPS